MPVPNVVVDDRSHPAWGAILAGAACSCAVTLVLIAFGSGAGLSLVSPWSNQGVSVPVAAWSAGLFLIAVAMIASTVGGYITGRLREGWLGVHPDERFFRDTAHGFTTWAVATLLTVVLIGGMASHLAAGAAGGVATAGAAAASQVASDATAGLVDQILRGTPTAPTPARTDQDAHIRAEIGRIIASALTSRDGISAGDKAYVAQVTSQWSGISQSEAEQRIEQVVTNAKQVADTARRTSAKLSFWLAAALFAGAFSASLAASAGGSIRNSAWWDTTRERR
jgi:hypothetical protein